MDLWNGLSRPVIITLRFNDLWLWIHTDLIMLLRSHGKNILSCSNIRPNKQRSNSKNKSFIEINIWSCHLYMDVEIYFLCMNSLYLYPYLVNKCRKCIFDEITKLYKNKYCFYISFTEEITCSKFSLKNTDAKVSQQVQTSWHLTGKANISTDMNDGSMNGLSHQCLVISPDIFHREYLHHPE